MNDCASIVKIIILIIIFSLIIYFAKKITGKGKYLNNKFVQLPYSVKCAFGETGCEEGDIDGESILYSLIFFIIGLIIPGQYLAILIIAVIYEMIKPYVNLRAKYIINPLLNFTAYSLGSLLSQNKHYEEKYHVLE